MAKENAADVISEKIKTSNGKERKKFKTTISIDWDVYEHIAKLAEQENRSVSNMIETILSKQNK